ncbi:MAG: phosphoheptose isomerase [Deltaproteobacteria bacterium RIFCSPLOWO2_01_44_7]|nr:MAG: phosphoheptose isomerase [Deltaproteobacteria bacterium RIFCSPHIGHO2_01_FULL_43_49]OGQ16097.1 MAG: phosphoheptose isomerase [Deltaproteobacteria bacterium RIFCSPHIGHO2_02_FULL_44_53]OGQ29058.1 MAG: phosphoheptose isomerase [Deltaproteobacteria bacterium RIFCSPHIGHO2_12_FULL_44_21]OGQ32614.1 MAG: phosphoheptose isomerase [Deltaproteobacteria bacterium RIFCSPLOWO2_01_FULL_45_74]OGQ38356.1 MAG: phosphoheptose isomerase [Deltaproteobacteria bacterium RIFCSPLOWO2_01_44_7]OGQ41715.1 MAG: pho
MKQEAAKQWLTDYFDLYRNAILETDVRDQLIQIKDLFKKTHAQGNKVVFIGNGGSAAMASHCAVDLTKNARIRCVNFNEADLLTCFANDFGYERCFEKALEFYADPGDVLVLISSSGKSPNILRAAEMARKKGLFLITLTGFASDNPLSNMGRINLCVDSRAYNVIENTHQIWLLAVCDLIIGKAEYAAS